MKIRDLDEDGFLEILLKGLPTGRNLIVGPGDDCAVVKAPGGRELLLLKTDCVVEGIHYLPDDDPARVGRKAINRAISDIAAMGGEPHYALVTIFSPPEVPVAYWKALYEGLGAAAERHSVSTMFSGVSKKLKNYALSNFLQQSAQTLLNFSAPPEAIIPKLKAIGLTFPGLYGETLFYRLQFLDDSAIDESFKFASDDHNPIDSRKRVEFGFANVLAKGLFVKLSPDKIENLWAVGGSQTRMAIIQNFTKNSQGPEELLKKSLSDPNEMVQYLGVSRIYELFSNQKGDLSRPAFPTFQSNPKQYTETALRLLNQRDSLE